MNETALKKTRYDAIDGLRAFSAIGIILMHMKANGGYSVSGFVYEKLISSFTNFVFLFMIVSAFGMCCGYYEKAVSGGLDIDKFYKKRYAKILPFFALLCLADTVISPSVNALRELFADLTLCFGFLPECGGITIIGVGWFLGIVFVFYAIFPFFCFLIKNKKRAWISFAVALLFNIFCCDYFKIERKNILFCMVFFLAGGLIFLYKSKLSPLARRFKPVIVILCLALAAAYFLIGGENIVIMLALFSLMLICAIAEPRVGREKKSTVLNNPVTRFLGGISMEIYLCHMMIFRVFEKLHLTHVFASDLLSYIFICVAVTAGATAFATAYRFATEKILPPMLGKIFKSKKA